MIHMWLPKNTYAYSVLTGNTVFLTDENRKNISFNFNLKRPEQRLFVEVLLVPIDKIEKIPKYDHANPSLFLAFMYTNLRKGIPPWWIIICAWLNLFFSATLTMFTLIMNPYSFPGIRSSFSISFPVLAYILLEGTTVKFQKRNYS